MMQVMLEAKERKNPNVPIEAEEITPAHFIENRQDLSVWRGNRKVPLEEVFEVTINGEASSAEDVEVILTGESGKIKRVGEYMESAL